MSDSQHKRRHDATTVRQHLPVDAALGAALITIGLLSSGCRLQLAEDGLPKEPAVPLQGKITRSGHGVDIATATNGWQNASFGAAVQEGATIRTGSRSEADVTLWDSCGMKLAPKTEVKVESLNRRGESMDAVLEALRGRVFIKSKKLPRRSRFQLKTPTGLIVVRGTEFFVEITEENETRVIVKRGRVTVRHRQDPAKTKDVSTHKRVSVTKKGLTEVKGVACDANSYWLFDHIILDDTSARAQLHLALKNNNPRYNGTGKFNTKDGKIIGARLGYTNIANLSPLSMLPLSVLDVSGTPLRDLSPLKGLPLTTLKLDRTKVSDLSALTGMKLTHLSCSAYRGGTFPAPMAIADLAPLKGLPLVDLNLGGCPVADISPLRNMPLQNLDLNGTKVTDLSPLEGMPLRRIVLPLKATDFSVLGGLSKLTAVGNAQFILRPAEKALHAADFELMKRECRRIIKTFKNVPGLRGVAAKAKKLLAADKSPADIMDEPLE